MKRMILPMAAVMLFLSAGCEKEKLYEFGTIFDEEELWIHMPPEGDTFTFHSSNGGFDYFSINYEYGRNIVWSEFGNPDDYWVTVVASGADDSGRYTELSFGEANASPNERNLEICVYRDSEMIFDRLSISQSGTEESPT